MTWLKQNKWWSSLTAVLLILVGWLGSNGVFQLYDRVSNSYDNRYDTQIASLQEFISINNNSKHFSYALNSPVRDTILYVHWKWAKHTGGAYCYYYTIDGADVDNSYYHARVAGKCNPEGFSLADQPAGFGFNSSIGVKLPYKIPPGKYTVTYYHLEMDGYHDKYQKWLTFNPIPFTVLEYK